MKWDQKKKNKIIKNNSIEGSAVNIVAQLEDLEIEDIPMVEISNVLIAACFTSKMEDMLMIKISNTLIAAPFASKISSIIF